MRCLVHQPHRVQVGAAPEGLVQLLLTCLWGQLRVQPAGREGPLLRASQQLSPRGSAASSFFQLRHPDSQDSASERAQLGRAKQGPETGFVPGPPAPPVLPQAWHRRPGPIQVLILVCLTLRPAVRQAAFGDRTDSRVRNSSAACVGQKTEPPAEPQARLGWAPGASPSLTSLFALLPKPGHRWARRWQIWGLGQAFYMQCSNFPEHLLQDLAVFLGDVPPAFC